MADITMCVNEKCPNSVDCYRVQARNNPVWQSYCNFEYEVTPDGVNCMYYIKMADKKFYDDKRGLKWLI